LSCAAAGPPPQIENTAPSPTTRHLRRAARAVFAHAAAALVVAAAAQGQPSRDSAATRNAGATGQRPRGGANPSHVRVSPWLPRVRLDNDAYNFWTHPAERTDEEYTNGVEFSFETLRGTAWGRHLGGGAADCGADTSRTGRCLTTTVAIGQDMYTPNLLRAPHTIPDWEDERPYAGWLYVSGTGRSLSRRSMRAAHLALGVTGKPALGQVSQTVAHWINAKYTTRATGWETQVGFQPGVQLAYQHAILAARGTVGSKAFLDVVPTMSAVAGTVRTSADAGARLRLGYNLSHPWDPRAWPGRSPLEYFVTVAGRAEYVARDFSLDGSLLDDARHVERVPEVREYSAGIGVRVRRLRFHWEASTRSRQYRTGPPHHTFSTMSASWEFHR
jgi:hypothetical protein